jgi:hypothetical protein
MLRIVEETTIHARPEAVFQLLTDFDGYASWNPWIIQAHGVAREGEIVTIRIKLGRRPMRVRHRILAVVPGVELRWCDLGWFTAIAYGERTRRLEPLAGGGGVKYRAELTIAGIGWRLVRALHGRSLEEGMKAETAALKRHAESTGTEAQEAPVA